MKRYPIVLMFALVLSSISLPAGETTIKFATLAPDSSTWMNVMRDFREELSAKTGGAVAFKIYANGVQGDEKDVVRKLRFNQLQGAGFTGVGLGEILPEVRILDTPFLFKNKEEVDYITQKFYDRFASKFEQKNYILLGLAEVGNVYIYTQKMVRSVKDMQGVKMWMWENDQLAEATFRAFGINPIPLSITDVHTSLQTGLIDGVYTPPLACVGFQWFTKVKYVLDVPLTNSNGAVVITKASYDKLTPEHQKILRELGRKHFAQLTLLSREDNRKAQQEMIKAGIVPVSVDDQQTLNTFEQIGRQVRRDLVGKLYDEALLNDIEQALQQFRSQNKKGNQ